MGLVRRALPVVIGLPDRNSLRTSTELTAMGHDPFASLPVFARSIGATTIGVEGVASSIVSPLDNDPTIQ
jgi:hypothetical protein